MTNFDNTTDEDVQTDVWYPKSLPDEFQGQDQGGMSTISPENLNRKTYDYVVVGGGIGGLYTVHALRSRLPEGGSILAIDSGSFFGKQSLSAISGGEISVGLGVGDQWARAGWGEETWNEFLRYTMYGARTILDLADGFECTTGYSVRTSEGLIVAITDEAMERHARKDAQAIVDLVNYDLKNRPGPSNGVLSVASLKDYFAEMVAIDGAQIFGGKRYHSGLLYKGEGAVNPAMLGVAMRYLARGEINAQGETVDVNPNIKVDFCEFLHADEVALDGTVKCSTSDGQKIEFSGKKVILAGAPPQIVKGINVTSTEAYRTLIAVTKPLTNGLCEKFRVGVHDTTRQYNYVWMDPVTNRLMWGTGDFKLYPDMSKAEMVNYARAEIQQAIGGDHLPEIEYIWSGDIPYTNDGFPLVFQNGNISGFSAPGGNGLAASVALAEIAAKAAIGDEYARQLMENLTKRMPDFDPRAIAAQTPDYLKSAPFKLALES